MDCFVVILSTGFDDLVVGVEPTETRARDLAGAVSVRPDHYLKTARNVYGINRGTAAGSVMILCVRGGHPVGVETTHDLT